MLAILHVPHTTAPPVQTPLHPTTTPNPSPNHPTPNTTHTQNTNLHTTHQQTLLPQPTKINQLPQHTILNYFLIKLKKTNFFHYKPLYKE